MRTREARATRAIIALMNAAPRVEIPLRSDASAVRRAALSTLSRTVMAQAIALFGTSPPAQIAEEKFLTDDNVRLLTRSAQPISDREGGGWIVKGSVSQTTTSDAPALKSTITPEFITSLTSAFTALAVIERTLQLRFDDNGAISVPGFVADASRASFVKEKMPIPVHSRVLTPCILDPSKLATISTLTREMATGSNAEQMILDVMKQDVGLAYEAALFDTIDAIPEERPAGLRFGVAPEAASDATDAEAAMIADIRTVVTAVAPVAGNEPILLIASPARARTMPLNTERDLSSFVILQSSAVADDDLIALAPRAIASASDSIPETITSRETLLHMDTAPVNISTPGDVGPPALPAVVAWPTISTYQTDNIALKVRMMVSWAKRDPRAVSWLTATNW
jgi:hypothetical protein